MNYQKIISKNNESKYNSGRWKEEEHKKFIEAILEYGNEWKKVQKIIKTRSSTQARSHAQKFFLRIKKNLCLKKSSFNFNDNNDNSSLINDNEKFSIKYFFDLLNGNEKKEKDKINDGKLSLEKKEKFLNFVSKFSNYDLNDNGSNINNSNNKIDNLLEKNIKRHLIKEKIIINKAKKKIFNISKEKKRKESFYSMCNLKYNNKDLTNDECTIYRGYSMDNILPFKNNEINSTISESDKNFFCGKKRKQEFDPFIINFEFESNKKEKEFICDYNDSEKVNHLFIEDNYLFENLQRNRKGSDNFDNFIHL